MAPHPHLRVVGGLLLALTLVAGLDAQEDSLRTALNAVDRRQKDLSDYSEYDVDGNLGEYGYPLESPDDIVFLPSEPGVDGKPDIEQLLLDYLENTRPDKPKRRPTSSAFRERSASVEQANNNYNYLENGEKLGRRTSSSTGNDGSDDTDRELWSPNTGYEKRGYYPRFGYDSAGLRKRSYKYEPADTFYFNENRNKHDFPEYRNAFDALEHRRWENNKSHAHRNGYYQRDFGNSKYFIEKRSGNRAVREHKRSTGFNQASVKTDPKVEKDLSTVFGTVLTTQPPVNVTKKKTKSKKETVMKKANRNKEDAFQLASEHPIEIEKKSINWSDYLGLDRRKKSSGDSSEDNKWILERYHKALILDEDKRSGGTEKKDAELFNEKDNDEIMYRKRVNGLKFNELKATEIDEKLNDMEEAIIDDALKYTGAHESATDPKEIQEVKDRIISRLATAYNLEKMRRALGDYKLSIMKEQQQLKHVTGNNKGNFNGKFQNEEKRLSVPRKQAVDDERIKTPESDNNIKCAQGDESCQEQSYKTPKEVLEQNTFDECPSVQKACRLGSSIVGRYAPVFESACNSYQMCLICSNNNWYVPIRQCNVLFISRALELCEAKRDCQEDMESSMKYLLIVSRGLKTEPLEDCEMACPVVRK